ncbi:hypothetical protein KSC_083360 [Ktedonobacter sp. SOSP1-52]|uniref:MerR family transcriptional regulator n=1 Tax=Ktedonobacter sp. SOSP1-52 TaxID=2778366 RepID=UPI001A3115B9|nr:hypothetical protein KSC_083360 [Ktedonobacter sp. SOSP1-52]
MIQSDVEQPSMLRIDELAQQVGMPSRTIRFYNTQGLLPPPVMKGRTAYYTQEHLVVLGIIRELKEHQNLSLEAIKRLLEVRDQQGDVQMHMALKQRHLKSLTVGGTQVHLAQEELARQGEVAVTRINELVELGLLFPFEGEQGERLFTGDDVLLLQLYRHLEELGLPLALPSLIRFQLKQLTRSEVAAYEQHLLPRWREEGLALEQQTERFEEVMALSDTLISLLHRKLLYQG